MFAIKTHGAMKYVSARRIKPGWDLEVDEDFVVDDYSPGMILDADLVTLRNPTQEEIAAIDLQEQADRKDKISSLVEVDPLVKAVVQCIRKGTLKEGTTVVDAKTAILAEL